VTHGRGPDSWRIVDLRNRGAHESDLELSRSEVMGLPADCIEFLEMLRKRTDQGI
jgi:hypothetical protein